MDGCCFVVREWAPYTLRDLKESRGGEILCENGELASLSVVYDTLLDAIREFGAKFPLSSVSASNILITFKSTTSVVIDVDDWTAAKLRLYSESYLLDQGFKLNEVDSFDLAVSSDKFYAQFNDYFK